MYFSICIIFITLSSIFYIENVSAVSKTKLTSHLGFKGSNNNTMFVKRQFKSLNLTTDDEEMKGSDYPNKDVLIVKEKESCKTIDGPGVGKPCIFPFIFSLTGRSYNSCTKDGDDSVKEYWCSTKVDDDGVHVSGNFGFCSKECPGVEHEGYEKIECDTEEPGIHCTIPFSYRGFTYHGCIKTDGEKYWLRFGTLEPNWEPLTPFGIPYF